MNIETTGKLVVIHDFGDREMTGKKHVTGRMKIQGLWERLESEVT